MQTDRERADVHWYDLLLSPISSRSFTSVWYWIALAGFWTVMLQRVMDVPARLLAEAERGDVNARQDAMSLARSAVRRAVHGRAAGAWAAAEGAFLVTLLVSLAVVGLQFAQALVPMVLPWIALRALDLRLARRLEAEGPDTDALVEHLLWHQLLTRVIAGAVLLLTILWGAWSNLPFIF